jgi:transmembrane sensor
MMETGAEKPVSESRFEQAADWHLRLRGELSPGDILEWEQWFSVPENQEAIEAMRSVTPVLGNLQRPALLSASEVSDDPYDGSVSVEQWKQGAPGSVGISRKRSRFLQHSAPYLALAAAIVAVTFVLGFTTYGKWGQSVEPLQVFQTARGEHRVVELSDGSKVTLGARTRLSAHYSATRRIILLEEGEALFSVAKNKQRPFTVVAAGGTITAVGTRFNVRSELNRVTVTVAEGIVDVAPAESTASAVNNSTSPVAVRAPSEHWQPTRLLQGQAVTYDEHKGRESVANAEPGATEWISGRLQYRSVPLKYVAADVERYLGKPIVLEDSAAADMVFTGTIDQGEVSDWLRALEKIFPLEVSTPADGPVLVRSRP